MEHGLMIPIDMFIEYLLLLIFCDKMLIVILGIERVDELKSNQFVCS